MLLKISHSAIKKFATCPAAYEASYIRKRVPAKVSEALSLGSLWHSALEQYWNSVMDGHSAEAAKTRAIVYLRNEAASGKIDVAVAAKLSGMIGGYEPPLEELSEVLEVERSFEITMPGMRGIRSIGIIDLVVRLKDGRKMVVEHKTTSLDITGDTVFWKGLEIDPQLVSYKRAAEADGVIFDVVRKPLLRLRQKETNEEYGARIRATMTEERGKYFGWREINLAHSDEWGLEIQREWMRRIRAARRSGVFPCNTASCTLYGKCEYINVCAGVESLDGPSFTDKTYR